jgi:hypothetical protein
MNIKEKVQDYKRREQDFNMKVESSARRALGVIY